MTPNCRTCKHLNEEGGLSCKAFPGGIPQPIISGQMPHDRVFQGQAGDTTYESTAAAKRRPDPPPKISNRSSFRSADFLPPVRWKVVGSQGNYSIVELGRDRDSGDMIVGKTLELHPQNATEYKAISLASLLKFAPGEIEIYGD